MELVEPSDDVGLVRRTQAGSAEAFELLVRQHEGAVRWFLTRALRDPSAADDLAQEVFLYVHQRLREFRGEGSLRAWLLGIARNLAAQHLRTTVRRRSREEGELSLQIARLRMERLARDPCDDNDRERTLAALDGCLQGLAPESRRVVQEHYFHRRTIEAIAREQDRNAGAVRVMLMRIRNALRDCIRKKLEPEE